MLKDFIRDFAGRWVCDTRADQNVEGLWQKGDALRIVAIHTPAIDQSGVQLEWQAEKDGKVALALHGITAWDPAAKFLRSIGYTSAGLFVDSTFTKQGEHWVQNGSVFFRMVLS